MDLRVCSQTSLVTESDPALDKEEEGREGGGTGNERKNKNLANF